MDGNSFKAKDGGRSQRSEMRGSEALFSAKLDLSNWSREPFQANLFELPYGVAFWSCVELYIIE